MFRSKFKSFSTLILGEHHNGSVTQNTFKLLQAAQGLSTPVHVLFAGKNIKPMIQTLQLPKDSCAKVFVADQESLAFQSADVLSSVCEFLHAQHAYKHIISSTSSVAKDCLPRLAAKLDVQPLSNVLSFDTLRRPIYADNAITELSNKQDLLITTIRETNFEAMPMENLESVPIEEIDQVFEGKTKVLSQNLSGGDKVSLNDAKIVVSGGRALKSKENFSLLDELAQTLGNAAVGASRAAVDAGYVPNDYQVGQTGKVVAPELYFAIGISGAIQHVAGMKDSKVIVAINKDAECPMFQIANYSLEGDLFKIVPELTEKLKQ